MMLSGSGDPIELKISMDNVEPSSHLKMKFHLILFFSPFSKLSCWISVLLLNRYCEEPCDFFCFPLRKDFLAKGSILSTAVDPDDIVAQQDDKIAQCSQRQLKVMHWWFRNNVSGKVYQ